MMLKTKLVPEGGRQTKPCEKRGCQELMSTPHCFLQLSPRCKKGGMTSRWHHISAGEHYCNECFDWIYRGHYPGHQLYLKWVEVWSADANTLPNVKTFITDQHLPYWVQCHKSGCGKWRRLPLELELFHVQLDSIQCQDCSLPEDESVAPVFSPYWIATLGYTPLLRHTLLAPLVEEYYPEGVGVSPSTVRYTCRKMAEGRKKQEQQLQASVPTSIASSQGGSESQHMVDWTVPSSTRSSSNSTRLQETLQSSISEEADKAVMLPKDDALPTPTSTPISMQWLQNWSQLQDKALNRLLAVVNDTSMALTAGQPPESALIVIKSFQKKLEDLRTKVLCVCRLIESLGAPEGVGSSLETLKSSTVLLQQIIQTTSNPLALQKRLVDQVQLALALNVTLQQQSVMCPHSSTVTVPPFPGPSVSAKSISTSMGDGSVADCASLHGSPMPSAGSGLGTGNGNDSSSLLIHLLTGSGSSGSSGQPVVDGSTVPPLKKAKLDGADAANNTVEVERQLENPPWQPLYGVSASLMKATTPLMGRPSLMDSAPIMKSASTMEPASLMKSSSLMNPSSLIRLSSLMDPASVMKSASLMDPSSMMKSPPSVGPVDLNHTALLRDPWPASVSPALTPSRSPPGSFHLLTVGCSSSPKLHTSPLSPSLQPLGMSPALAPNMLPAQRLPPSVTAGVATQGTATPSSSVPALSSLGVRTAQSVSGSVKTHSVPVAKKVIIRPPDMQCVSLPAVLRRSPAVPHSGLLHDPFHPFNHPDDGERAMAFTPDVMTEEEMAAFDEYSKSPVLEVYLMLRNLVLALWHRNCKSYLSVGQCFEELNTRGLVRIWCLGALQRIVHFLTRRGYINYGCLDNAPVPFPIAGNVKTCRVLVIGAGPAGIGCAMHLQQFGYQVTVLEAKATAGGRCHDNSSLGATLSLGAMIVTGIDNNPITTLCHQMGFPLHLIVDDKCDLISENGKKPPLEMDKKIDNHFNTCLDRLAEWRSKEGEDCSLEDKLLQINQELQKSRGYTVTEVVVTVPLAVLRSGDIQFYPPLPERKMDALRRLGVGVIEKLTAAFFSGGGRKKTEEGSSQLPIHLVNSKPLASDFRENYQCIIVQFPSPFWRDKMNTPHFFGHVSSSEHQRGLFPVFYDVTEKPSDTAGPFVLLSTVCGAAVRLLDSLTDEELVDLFVSTLKTLFPDLDVPSPLGYLVSHWRSDPYARMSYSYAAVGSSGEDYRTMAEDCYQKLYFAGEGTNELYPQTVTGAYLSGIREACKIIESK